MPLPFPGYPGVTPSNAPQFMEQVGTPPVTPPPQAPITAPPGYSNDNPPPQEGRGPQYPASNEAGSDIVTGLTGSTDLGTALLTPFYSPSVNGPTTVYENPHHDTWRFGAENLRQAGTVQPEIAANAIEQAGKEQSEADRQVSGLLGREQERQINANAVYAAARDRDLAGERQRMADIDQKSKEVAANQYDAGRFWRNPGNIISAIGAAMITWASPDKSVGMKIINQAIDRDMQAQQQDHENMMADKLGLQTNLKDYRQLMGNRQAGDMIYEASMKETAAMQLEQIASQLHSKQAVTNATIGAAKLRQEAATIRANANMAIAHPETLMTLQQRAAHESARNGVPDLGGSSTIGSAGSAAGKQVTSEGVGSSQGEGESKGSSGGVNEDVMNRARAAIGGAVVGPLGAYVGANPFITAAQGYLNKKQGVPSGQITASVGVLPGKGRANVAPTRTQVQNRTVRDDDGVIRVVSGLQGEKERANFAASRLAISPVQYAALERKMYENIAQNADMAAGGKYAEETNPIAYRKKADEVQKAEYDAQFIKPAQELSARLGETAKTAPTVSMLYTSTQKLKNQFRDKNGDVDYAAIDDFLGQDWKELIGSGNYDKTLREREQYLVHKGMAPDLAAARQRAARAYIGQLHEAIAQQGHTLFGGRAVANESSADNQEKRLDSIILSQDSFHKIDSWVERQARIEAAKINTARAGLPAPAVIKVMMDLGISFPLGGDVGMPK